MKKIKEYAAPSVILLIICVVAAFLLAVTNNVTAPKIAEVEKQNEISARQEVYSSAASFGEEFVNADGVKLVPALDKGGSLLGYVVTTAQKGYGGAVTVITGVSLEGEVVGINVNPANETPGLGANASRESFISQFIGKIAGIGVSKNAPAENEIKALTGATITSKAVTDAVNAAIEAAGGVNNG